jgi:hypothetical protein
MIRCIIVRGVGRRLGRSLRISVREDDDRWWKLNWINFKGFISKVIMGTVVEISIVLSDSINSIHIF